MAKKKKNSKSKKNNLSGSVKPPPKSSVAVETADSTEPSGQNGTSGEPVVAPTHDHGNLTAAAVTAEVPTFMYEKERLQSETSDRADSATPTFYDSRNGDSRTEVVTPTSFPGPSCPDSGHASPNESDDSEAWQTVGVKNRSNKWITGLKGASGFRSAQNPKSRGASDKTWPPDHVDSRSSPWNHLSEASGKPVGPPSHPRGPSSDPTAATETSPANSWAARAKAGLVNRKATYDFLPSFVSSKDKRAPKAPDFPEKNTKPNLQEEDTKLEENLNLELAPSDEKILDDCAPKPKTELKSSTEVEPPENLMVAKQQPVSVIEPLNTGDETQSGQDPTPMKPNLADGIEVQTLPEKSLDQVVAQPVEDHVQIPLKIDSQDRSSTSYPTVTKDSAEEEPKTPGKESFRLSPELILKHPLNHCWVFWSNSLENSYDWSSNLVSHFEFATIEDFWSVYHHIIYPIVSLPTGRKIDYSIFIKGINPTWEDPLNEQGGRWTVSYTVNYIVQPWLEGLLFLIGETDFALSAMIHGCVLSMRPRNAKVALWIRSALKSNQHRIEEVGRSFRNSLPPPMTRMKFEPHESAPKFKVASPRLE